ncbi:hypothetical protein [Leptolyngbya iicbica]|uniref:Uncharacterized protein n=2 Tax=Cyanophyceae TaxID=3028117 RepID=A0A4Q7EKC5_9CYAN|nr:hypothetical protein [Leptolyngbya sp. LK]RZM82259.1 hypothetical protein DYY88_03115 [Leptolyngbya sp. LK]
MNPHRQNWPLQVGAVISLLILSIALLGLQKQRLQAIQTPNPESLAIDAANEEQQRELQLTLLQSLPDFGFQNLWADWTFLNFLQYFGNFEYRQETSYRLSGDYFEIILDRDPYAYLPYEYLSSSVSLFAGEPERAVAMQEAGLALLAPDLPPKSYFIWRHKGIDEILFLDDYDASAKSHAMAAAWAAQSSFPGAKEDQHSLKDTADFLAKGDFDPRAVQITAWAQLIRTAPDAQTQDKAIERLRSLFDIEVVWQEDGTFLLQQIAPSEVEDAET